MPAAGRTTVFPRKDNIYEGKSSIPYDEARSNIWINREADPKKSERLRLWILHAIMGFIIGFIAFIMDRLETNLVAVNRNIAQYCID